MQLIPGYLEYEKRIHSEEIISYPKASCIFSLSLTEIIECSKIRFVEQRTKNHGKLVSWFMCLTNPNAFLYTAGPHHR